MSDVEKLAVYLRPRPAAVGIAQSGDAGFSVDIPKGLIKYEDRGEDREQSFDAVWPLTAVNIDIYSKACAPVVDGALKGVNGVLRGHLLSAKLTRCSRRGGCVRSDWFREGTLSCALSASTL